MSWATPTEANTWTGKTITQSDLDQANAVLDIFVGVTSTTESEGKIKWRDLRLLKKAEAYQAAWMNDQVELYGRSDITLADGDGVSFSKGDPDMHVLAPLAKRCVKKLSWNRSRSMQPLTPQQAHLLRGQRTPQTIGDNVYGTEGEFLDDEDYLGGWEPL